MPQTFYIENDEEIISVIGRLRKSSAERNFFVFPKRALVLQSIVNLRLFQREAQKLGKKIVIVTQDEAGKKLAEKAGVETESYSDDFSGRAAHVELSPSAPTEQKNDVPVVPQSSIPRSQDIGSMDFYAPTQTSIKKDAAPSTPIKKENPSDATTLRIRNASPPKQTSLNSLRSQSEEIGIVKPNVPLFNPTISMGGQYPETPLPSAQGSIPNFSPASRMQAPQAGTSREERLKNFFGPASAEKEEKFPETTQLPRRSDQPTRVISKKVSHIFLILGGISILSLLGVGLFLFLPKAEVHVVPRKIVRTMDQQFDGRTGGDMSEANIIPVRIVERSQNVLLSQQATGTSQGSAQKARGTVTITNEFSSEPQSLVATTRFESPDGKVFRLIEGVTVPGMTNQTPGTISAAVVADQTGSEYNISPSAFTIPGFKGSAKYAKFSAKSSKAMSGGGDATGTDISVISKADLDKAEIQAKEKARNDYLEATKNELQPEEKILEDGMEITTENQASLPVVGTAAASFDYQTTYKVRAFIFSEKTVREKIEGQTTEKVGGVSFRPVSVVLSYGESLPNYGEGTLRLKAHAEVTLESVIDREKLAEELLGKNEDGINELLAEYPEVNKIQIQIKPQWFSSAIPKSKDRVIIMVDPGEE